MLPVLKVVCERVHQCQTFWFQILEKNILTQSGKVEEARSYARSDARILNHDNRTKPSRHHSLSAVGSSFFFRQCFLLQGCVIRGPGSNFRIVLCIQTLSQETLAFLSGDAETLPPRAERGKHKGWEEHRDWVGQIS